MNPRKSLFLALLSACFVAVMSLSAQQGQPPLGGNQGGPQQGGGPGGPGGPGGGQPQGAPITLTTHRLTPEVYWINCGDGCGNTGFIVGDKGVIVFDTTKSADGGKKLQSEIAKVTPKPVTTVILSHADGDHVGGLSTFPAGITIIAQENCKKLLQDGIASGHGTITADYLPNHTVDKNEDVTIDGVRLELLHWAPAHTTADLALYLPAQKIVFTGDLIVLDQPRAALVKRNQHANSSGWIESGKGLLALDAITYVVGHGEQAQTRQQIEQRVNQVIAERDKVKELVAKGETLDQIKVDVADPPSDWPAPKPGARVFMPFSEVVYRELTEDK
jgi:glyoxylase-like metal-dependent hydrolase (beta-lactamase superfamily II)